MLQSTKGSFLGVDSARSEDASTSDEDAGGGAGVGEVRGWLSSRPAWTAWSLLQNGI